MPLVTAIADLDHLVRRSLADRRPILHHLNADTSWLIQLPVPSAHATPGKKFFNIILDPWLSGPQSDVASWFSRQWHVEPPALGSIAAVNDLCRRTEEICVDTGSSTPQSEPDFEGDMIDAVVLSHEFTDHCHKPTLLECDRRTPVIATTKAAALVRGWKHFDTVIETPPFGGGGTDWHDALKLGKLPGWVGVGRLVNEKDAFYYHSAVLIAFDLTEGNSEAVIYTPHGIHPPSLVPITKAVPEISTVAFLHGLHDVRIDWGQQLNLGAHNGLQAQRLIKAKYWVGTHDEVKKGGGVVSWFLRRKVYTVKDALEQERDKQAGAGDAEKEDSSQSDGEGEQGVLGKGDFLDLKNGQSALLE